MLELNRIFQRSQKLENIFITDKGGIQSIGAKDKKVEVNAQSLTCERWQKNYVSRKDKRTRQASIEYNTDTSIRGLEVCIKNSKEKKLLRSITAIIRFGLKQQQKIKKQNWKCCLYGNKREKINHAINKRSKLFKGVYVSVLLSWEEDSMEIVQEIGIWPF